MVDLADKKVVKDFSAGQVKLSGVDTVDDGTIAQDDSITVRREPDGVTWIDDDTFATANEGDYVGGSRGFTVWKRNGEVVYDAGNSLRPARRRARPLPGGPLRRQGHRARERRVRQVRRQAGAVRQLRAGQLRRRRTTSASRRRRSSCRSCRPPTARRA